MGKHRMVGKTLPEIRQELSIRKSALEAELEKTNSAIMSLSELSDAVDEFETVR